MVRARLQSAEEGAEGGGGGPEDALDASKDGKLLWAECTP